MATTGYVGLRSALDSFETLTIASDNASRGAQADRDFVALRLNMQMYFDKGEDKVLARVQELAKSVRGGYAFVQANSRSNEQKAMAAAILSQVDQYMAVFALRRTISDETTPQGNRLHGEMKELMQSAVAENDLTLATLAGSATEQFLWGRVNGLLHNQTRNPKLEEAARAQFATMERP